MAQEDPPNEILHLNLKTSNYKSGPLALSHIMSTSIKNSMPLTNLLVVLLPLSYHNPR